MPQFDIFSFSSQLFWVFFSFTFLYFSLTYYILPSISVTLKVRRRKLSNLSSTSNADVDSLAIGSSSIPFSPLSIKTDQVEFTSNLLEINKQILKNNVSKIVPLSFYSKLPDLIILGYSPVMKFTEK